MHVGRTDAAMMDLADGRATDAMVAAVAGSMACIAVDVGGVLVSGVSWLLWGLGMCVVVGIKTLAMGENAAPD